MRYARTGARSRWPARLGWQVEGNWADPLVFFIFAILRPLATALILVLMYQVIAGGQRGSYFNYLYVSNAFFVLVIQTMSGLAWTIIDDRENYKMLKYIYTSPARKFSYLIGRAVAKISLGLMTTVILLVVGVLFLGLTLDLGNIEWGWLVLYFPLGMVSLVGMGIVLAGVALVIARHGAAIGEVTAGSLLLFSGAYFPIDVLPAVLQTISLCVPITYWLGGYAPCPERRPDDADHDHTRWRNSRDADQPDPGLHRQRPATRHPRIRSGGVRRRSDPLLPLDRKSRERTRNDRSLDGVLIWPARTLL